MYFVVCLAAFIYRDLLNNTEPRDIHKPKNRCIKTYEGNGNNLLF